MRHTLFRCCSLALLVAPVACGPAARNDCVGDSCTGDDDGGGGGGGGGGGSCTDNDGDGFTTCDGDCNDNDPNVNPGAYDIPGDGIDNDCDGSVDNYTTCDTGLLSMTDANSFAKAIDICQTTTAGSDRWGLISAAWSHSDGTGTPNNAQTNIMYGYGTGVTPKEGMSLGVIATGKADASTDAENYEPPDNQSPYPSDFSSAHGGTIPNAPGCPSPQTDDGDPANYAIDPVMLTLTIKVPTNASSFTMDINFYTSEFPEWVCSPFNDFFAVLLDSSYMGTGSAANPADKNLAFYSPDNGVTKYPVGVNLASTGLFTQCVNGTTGCDSIEFGGTSGSISTCTATTELQGTSFATADEDECDSDSLEGGATGWLQTSGNVKPGETMKLRIALWNTGDNAYQSLALIDNFAWNGSAAAPGTVIFSDDPKHGGEPLNIVNGQMSPLAP